MVQKTRRSAVQRRRRHHEAIEDASIIALSAKQDLLCTVCAMPFHDPVRTPQCQHAFCRLCIARVAWGAATTAAAELRRALTDRRRPNGYGCAAHHSSVNAPLQPTAAFGCPLCRTTIDATHVPMPSGNLVQIDTSVTTEILQSWPVDDVLATRVAIHFNPRDIIERSLEAKTVRSTLDLCIAQRRPLGAEISGHQALHFAGGYAHRALPTVSIQPHRSTVSAPLTSLDNDDDDDDDMAWCRHVSTTTPPLLLPKPRREPAVKHSRRKSTATPQHEASLGVGAKLPPVVATNQLVVESVAQQPSTVSRNTTWAANWWRSF
jgi:hypothetical protein